jgi:hypothetical protein
MRVCWTIRLKRHLSQLYPDAAHPFAVLALQFVGHPEQRAVKDGAVVASEFDNARLDDEATQLDQMPRALATLDLPGAHIMTHLRRLVPMARRPVASQRRQRRG